VTSPKVTKVPRKNTLPKVIWIVATGITVLGIATIAAFKFSNNIKHDSETKKQSSVSSSPSFLPSTTPTPPPLDSRLNNKNEDSTKLDPTQAVLAETKAWPIVLADNFTSPKNDNFSDINSSSKWATHMGLISSDTLHLSCTPKVAAGATGIFLAKLAGLGDSFYLRVDVKKSRGPDQPSAGLVFRASVRRRKAICVYGFPEEVFPKGLHRQMA